MSPEKYVRSLYATADAATEWFRSVATNKTPSEWKKRGSLDDAGTGAVYTFFDAHDGALYVGQTSTSLKKRACYPTSRHYDTQWWKNWKTVRFLNITDETDRFALELLLILGLSPQYNKKPSARDMNDMFKRTNNLIQRTCKRR